MRKRRAFAYAVSAGVVALAALALHLGGPAAFAEHHEKSYSSVIVAPIVEGQVDAWHDLLAHWGEEPDGLLDFNKRHGLTRHAVWLAHTPGGPVAVVLHEGPGGATLMEKLAASDHEFDKDFREKLSKLHGIDFSAPPPGPPSPLVLDSTQEAVMHMATE